MKINKNRIGQILADVLVIGLVFILAACQSPTPASTPTSTAVPATPTPAPDGTAVVPVEPTVPGPTPTLFVQPGAKTTASGLQYLEITAGNGAAPQPGNIIAMNYTASLTDGTVLFTTSTNNQPLRTVWGRNQLLPGWEEGIGLMKVGGKAKLVIPPSLAFGEQGTGLIPPSAQVVIEMELISAELAPLPTDVKAEQYTKTASSLQYYDISVGSGTEAIKNYNISTDYTIWVKTDKGYDYIDSSIGYTPVEFVVGRGGTVFPGWDEGVAGMKVGGKRQLLIPPELALGATGNRDIPPNATLLMEISLVKSVEPRLPAKVDEKNFTTTSSGLKYYDMTVGTGNSPTTGQTVTVHYTGWLQDGTQFDSSVDRNEPFSFKLGAGEVIPGWDEGVLTMKVGGKRQLVIPPALGYGEQGAGSTIPPNSILIFEVELLEVKP